MAKNLSHSGIAFLKVIGFKPGEGLGFIVAATAGMKALGTAD